MEGKTNIGERIKRLRKVNNLSQEELARSLHTSRQTVSRWETNRSIPDIDMLEKVASVFEMEVQDLLDEKTVNKKWEQKEMLDSYLPLAILMMFSVISVVIPFLGVVGNIGVLIYLFINRKRKYFKMFILLSIFLFLMAAQNTYAEISYYLAVQNLETTVEKL
ncbi:helix-turn-helix domain-containing protein [Faecalimonas sp.]